MKARVVFLLTVLSIYLLTLSLGRSQGSPLHALNHNGGRTWKTLDELSADEKARIDLSENTPRYPEIPYLPAEPYPFQPPFTAEEMGYRMMEFTQRPRWSCAFANLFGSITSQGFLLGQGQAVNLVTYPSPAGVAEELVRKPGEEIYRQLTQILYPPEAYGSQGLVVRYRTDKDFTKKEDIFFYSPSLRRVRHQNQSRRGDRYPSMAQSLDDSSGRSAWEFAWRLIGTDVLYETVRFPLTRPRVVVTESDGSLREVATQDLKLMGTEYPFYTPDGGVECYVVEARAKEDWLPDYYAPRILYWLDTHAFFPLRTELYGRDGKLMQVEVRLTKLVNPDVGERGYSPFILINWDMAADLLTYTIRDGMRLTSWSTEDTLTFFRPDFMRRQWFLTLVKSQLGVNKPEEFFLRPALEWGKFPTERPIELSADLQERIRAQDAVGHLVFEVPKPQGTQHVSVRE
ncbi:MAG: outer membrane lipoprotein-sorting protein [Deltaproteobacteria bacterium]|nr:outer membrane lipoprotein-sorting protein [Deltaproteobacteria bacterium]